MQAPLAIIGRDRPQTSVPGGMMLWLGSVSEATYAGLGCSRNPLTIARSPRFVERRNRGRVAKHGKQRLSAFAAQNAMLCSIAKG